MHTRPALLIGAMLVSALSCGACSDPAKLSVEQSKLHVTTLAQTVQEDVSEIRKGLPEGAKHFVGLYRAKKPKAASPAEAGALGGTGAAPVEGDAGSPAPGGSAAAATPAGSAATATVKAGAPTPEAPAAAAAAEPGGADAGAPVAVADGGAEGGAGEPPPAAPAGAREEGPDPATVREALGRAREKVADLRVAKSTFFALADSNGLVIRNDQDQDRMAGKGLFSAYPELRKALAGKVVETRGSMPEAAGIGNRGDAQWVIAAPVVVDGTSRALYVTGWSWSAYAYRLQFKLRSDVESSRDKGKNPPLVYVLMLVDDATYAWDAPDVDVKAVTDLRVFDKLQGDAVYSQVLEVTGTRFGFAAKAVPALGPRVAVAVLRAET